MGVKLPFDPLTDFTPIGKGVNSCNFLTGRPTLPAPGSLAPELEARTCAAVEAVAS